MRLRPTVLLVVATCVALATVPGAVWPTAQERAPGTIRVRITLVPINVVVTDQTDRPVTDLKASDFTILEDGVRQQVSHFALQTLAATTDAPARPATALLRRIATAELTPERRRTFLIVLGRGRLQQPSKGIDGLLQFVRTRLLPQDVVAVFVYNRATDFTTDHERVAQVVVRVNRPDLTLSYRHGYYARESVQPFDRKAFLSYSRISAAASYAQEVKDIGVKAAVKAVPAASGGGQEAQVDLVIQVSKLPFAGEGGRHKAALQITTFYGDARGRSLGDLWQTLDLNLREDTWRKALKGGIPFSTRVPLQAAGQTFKIVVYSYDADKVGSVTARLK
jgi:hypothetical protein